MNQKTTFIEKIKLNLPGILLAVFIAIVAKFIEGLLPVSFIGASVLALFIGILFNRLRPVNGTFIESGVIFTSKRFLKFAIVLLGASLNIGTILEVGQISLVVLFFTLLTAFGGGYILGRIMGLDWKMSSLISSGIGICGGTAIASVAPVIDAEDHQISYAMSYTFIFDMFLILLFPLVGQWLGLSNESFGLWAGTAINDTASVLAAGYTYSETAGDFATMVKLTRTLAIIPLVIGFSLSQISKEKKEQKHTGAKMGTNILNVFPTFILGFLGFALLYSLGFIPETISQGMKDISKFLMVVALASIGLKTNLKDLKQSGVKPLIYGLILSSAVISISLIVQYFMGLI